MTKSFNNIRGGITQGSDAKDPNASPKNAGLVRQILNPIYSDVARGKPAHGAGRAGANAAAIVFGGEIADAAAAEAEPATVRTPLVSDIEALSPAGQQAYDAALASGKSPSTAFQEAQALDEAASAAGIGPKRATPAEPALPPESVPLPEGLSREGQSIVKSAIEGGTSPAEAEQLARDLDAAEGGDTGPGPNAAGNKAQRGPKRII